MFCIYCGNKIEEDAHFCTRCGKPIAGSQAPAAPPTSAPPRQQTEAVRQGADRLRQLLTMLHDNDFDASDMAGEMRCPMSEVQNGFIHLIIQASEVNIAIVNNSNHLLTEQEKGVMSLLRHLDVANPKIHLRLDISEFAHDLRILHNMTVDDIGPMLKGIIYRLEAVKPGMAAVKAGVKTASVASTLGKTAATATTQTGAQVLAGSAQRAGQTMKNVLRATQVTGGKAGE
ncbi:MAG: zinc ribbon domain-containing protein [Bacteroidales bacterium]|nr:zinc ribbon domain-containing protein [Candidatus Physcousia equi]